MHPDISAMEKMGRKTAPEDTSPECGDKSCSEQEVSDGGEQHGQLGLDVVGLSDRVAAEIKTLQLGAGGQRLKICQAGDFCTSELEKKKSQERSRVTHSQDTWDGGFADKPDTCV